MTGHRWVHENGHEVTVKVVFLAGWNAWAVLVNGKVVTSQLPYEHERGRDKEAIQYAANVVGHTLETLGYTRPEVKEE